jgi:hypothetical protein
MYDKMDSGPYWEGYNCGMNSGPWTDVQHKYPAGSRAFHKFLEGHADGMKARYLIKHSHSH